MGFPLNAFSASAAARSPSPRSLKSRYRCRPRHSAPKAIIWRAMSGRELRPPTPRCLPCLRQAAATCGIGVAHRSGWSNCPGTPSELHRSLVPISSMSRPGTAAISSAFSTAVTDSIMATTKTASFISCMVSAAGPTRNRVCGFGPSSDRLPLRRKPGRQSTTDFRPQPRFPDAG